MSHVDHGCPQVFSVESSTLLTYELGAWHPGEQLVHQREKLRLPEQSHAQLQPSASGHLKAPLVCVEVNARSPAFQQLFRLSAE